MSNIFKSHITEIIAYYYDAIDAGERAPEWHTSIDMWLSANEEKISAFSTAELARMRSEFIIFVGGKKFNRDGTYTEL